MDGRLTTGRRIGAEADRLNDWKPGRGRDSGADDGFEVFTSCSSVSISSMCSSTTKEKRRETNIKYKIRVKIIISYLIIELFNLLDMAFDFSTCWIVEVPGLTKFNMLFF